MVSCIKATTCKVSVIETPSGQNVQLTLRSNEQHHLYLSFILDILHSAAASWLPRWLIWYLICLLSIFISSLCVCWWCEDSSWTVHLSLFFLQSFSLFLFLSRSFSLSGRPQRNWSLGGSREEPGKGGTKGRPSAAITTPHLLCPLASRPSLPWSPRSLASAPN